MVLVKREALKRESEIDSRRGEKNAREREKNPFTNIIRIDELRSVLPSGTVIN
jgi:ribosomal protein L19E